MKWVWVLGLAWMLIPVQSEAGGPDWVNQESTQYPRALFLTGVGHGSSRKAAEDAAYAAIARVFHVQIESKTREWEEYFQSSESKGGHQTGTRLSQSMTIDHLTRVSTQKSLENVSIAEVWEDPRSTLVYALAVMDRKQTGSLIRGRIREMEDRAERLYRTALGPGSTEDPGETGSGLQKVRRLHGALKALLVRESLLTDLSIIEPGNIPSESAISLEAVSKDFRQTVHHDFRVALETSGPYADQIRAAALQGLTEEGLVVTDPMSRPGGTEGRDEGADEPPGEGDVVMTGKLGLERLDLQGRPFFRWQLEFSLTDWSTGRVFGFMSRQGREGHLTLPEAEARAVRAAQRSIREGMGPFLAGAIWNEE